MLEIILIFQLSRIVELLNMLKNSCNKKVPGKFKDECVSKCIIEFIGLRCKMYSFMLDDKKNVSKAEMK